VVFEVARAAEAAGLDGVFVYDHLFRLTTGGERRPALEPVTLLGALAEVTRRITLGALVFRAALRPPASLQVAVATLGRIAPGRLVVAVGAGDRESREENESFGIGFGTVDVRLAQLDAAVRATRDEGVPVWIGGLDPPVRDLAASSADGWNAWGIGVEDFRAQADTVRSQAMRTPFTCSWSGLVVIDVDDDAAQAKARRLGAREGTIVGGPTTLAESVARYAAAGAEWIILGPVDSSDPGNAVLFGEVADRLR
jgi:alkanesulfonate monooxygenase SsuD/methylene tetrahydromethanopterin reductase-like flavin-dependent oxidoreductase (luciferase family)